MVSTVNTGTINMPKLLRHMSHRTNNIREVVFQRDAIYNKDYAKFKKNDSSAAELSGPPVNFGYETSSTADASFTKTQDSGSVTHKYTSTPELTIGGLKVLQTPVISRSGMLERTGHRITGECEFYTPSLATIKQLDNFSETTQFDEFETYDKFIDIERVIYNPSDSAANDNTNSGSMWSDEWDLFTGQTLAGYQIDRLQFKLRRTKTNDATTTWNSILVDKIDYIKIYDDSDALITLEPTSSTLAPRIGPNNTWNTFDIPIRDLAVGDKLSYYLNGYRLEFNVTAVGFDLDKMEGVTNTVKRIQIAFEDKVNLEFKDVYLYKEAQWSIESIKDYRDEYMQIAAVRVRGDRTSRRRAYG
jgi:hypothetical protein